MKVGIVALGILTLILVAGCGAVAPTVTPASPTLAPADTPTPGAAAPADSAPAAAAPGTSGAGHITLQHILIGFKGTIPGKDITRTQDEARTLANQVYAQAKAGADFDALVVKYTDDSPPGIYSLSDTGVVPGPGE